MPYKAPTDKQISRRGKGRTREPDMRPSAAERGYDARWRRIRMMHLRNHPLCAECLKDGRTEPASEVHHKVPLAAGGDHSLSNLMSVCRACHNRLEPRRVSQYNKGDEKRK